MILTTAFFDEDAGRLAFGSVGAAYADLLASVSGSVRKILITNSLNAETALSLDDGAHTLIYLPAATSLVFDLDTSMHWSGSIQVKHTGSAPTSGAISAGVIKAK